MLDIKVRNLFENLINSNDIFKEGFSNNSRISSSESFEEFINQQFQNIGFPDYTDEWTDVRKTAKIENRFFQSETKTDCRKQINLFKKTLENNPKKAIKLLNMPIGLIEQPLSSKRQPDLVVWWTTETSDIKVLIIDIKTGGGLAPKINDKLLEPHHIAIFNSRNKKIINRKTTISFASDIWNKETYEFVEDQKNEHDKWLRKNKDFFKKNNHKIQANFNPRNRVDNHQSDWFKDLNGLTRKQREEKVLEYICKTLLI